MMMMKLRLPALSTCQSPFLPCPPCHPLSSPSLSPSLSSPFHLFFTVSRSPHPTPPTLLSPLTPPTTVITTNPHPQRERQAVLRKRAAHHPLRQASLQRLGLGYHSAAHDAATGAGTGTGVGVGAETEADGGAGGVDGDGEGTEVEGDQRWVHCC